MDRDPFAVVRGRARLAAVRISFVGARATCLWVAGLYGSDTRPTFEQCDCVNILHNQCH